MDKSAADAYVYAKASGMLARSYVGERACSLFTFPTLQELWSFLFKKDVPVVPETLLAKALEEEAFEKFVSDFKSLLANYSSPASVLTALLQYYDYENIKDIGSALALKESTCPKIQNISPFNIIDYKKWPDLAAITIGGPFDWYKKPSELKDQHIINYKIDCQYVQSIWEATKTVSLPCRKAVQKLLSEKIVIDNCVWALRLRIYYKMEKDEIIPLLAYSSDEKKLDDPFVRDMLKVLDYELDNYEHWRNWKFNSLLNPHEEGVIWNVDPRWISNAYKKIYVQKAYRLFHMYPFTECPMICWFIVKRNELDNIRTASESLRLNINAAQAMQIAGVSEVNNG